jgi:hypothetical protein
VIEKVCALKRPAFKIYTFLRILNCNFHILEHDKENQKGEETEIKQ